MKTKDMNLEYSRASSGKRLANYLIDVVAFYIILIFVAIVLELLFPNSVSGLETNPIVDRLITLFFYGLVMFLIEMCFQGKSLGKLITGTRAMTLSGETLSFEKALIRNFVRAVPFNALSALGTPCSPWHDNWSDTIVVDEKKLELVRKQDEFYSDLRNQNTKESEPFDSLPLKN
ncbi:RDD family protein [Pedobacter sp. KR3-3]|uniref:RDD family protein n=1 Tax=Pedobacter albus TaxID=3113905 RepID=A0ABU7IB76_9SPHI|nr:RDD family protein [Pedobacter sp. KR3-3]MEE1946609.1 RDD family protein [Pedobacter sp. KR3-3]